MGDVVLVVLISSRVPCPLHLSFVDVAVLVADHTWKQVIWEVDALSQWEHLRTELADTDLECLLKVLEGTVTEESRIKDHSALVKEDVKGKNFA